MKEVNALGEDHQIPSLSTCWWLGCLLDMSQQGSCRPSINQIIAYPNHTVTAVKVVLFCQSYPKKQWNQERKEIRSWERSFCFPGRWWTCCSYPSAPVASLHFTFHASAGAFLSCQMWQLSNHKAHFKNNPPHYTISSFDPIRTIAAVFLRHILNESHPPLAGRTSSSYPTSSRVGGWEPQAPHMENYMGGTCGPAEPHCSSLPRPGELPGSPQLSPHSFRCWASLQCWNRETTQGPSLPLSPWWLRLTMAKCQLMVQ